MDELRAAVTLRRVHWMLLGVLAVSACAPAEHPSNRSAATNAGIAALPVPLPMVEGAARPSALDEKLAMFRQGLRPPDALSGGESSREALVRRFVASVGRRDTSAVRAMVLDRAEFAWLYYPTSPYTRPPTIQEAPLAWFLIVENSQKGITRVFNRLGAMGSEYAGHRCDPVPSREGANLFWRDCVVTLRTGMEAPVTLRLFGTIIERAGHFKFFSYANDF